MYIKNSASTQVISIYLRNRILDIRTINFTTSKMLNTNNLYLISVIYRRDNPIINYYQYMYLGKSMQIYHAT